MQKDKDISRREFFKKVAKGTAVLAGMGVLSPSLNTIITEAEGEGVVLFPETGLLFHLNETGLFVYKKLKEGYSIKETAKELSKEYEVDEMQALEDVKEFVLSMKEKGYL